MSTPCKKGASRQFKFGWRLPNQIILRTFKSDESSYEPRGGQIGGGGRKLVSQMECGRLLLTIRDDRKKKGKKRNLADKAGFGRNYKKPIKNVLSRLSKLRW